MGNMSMREQSEWAYNASSGIVSWMSASGKLKCLAVDGDVLSLVDCTSSGGAGSSFQTWTLEGGRLWQKALSAEDVPDGILSLQRCNASRPGQHWKLQTKTVGWSHDAIIQNNLGFRGGGCWEITACAVADGAQVGVNFGCKALPPQNWSNPCDANGAWSLNENGTITSVMDGKCLQIDSTSGMIVNVATCTGHSNQTWAFTGSVIESVGTPGYCVDSGVIAPPAGTTGRCIAVAVTNDIGGAGSWGGVQGPALKLDSGQNCDANKKPSSTQEFSFTNGTFSTGSLCGSARHGKPTPFGPLQLWSKPQPGGAVAIALLNRAAEGSTAVDAEVKLDDLPGLERGDWLDVRDVWAKRDLAPEKGDSFNVSVPGGDSRLLLLTPRRQFGTQDTNIALI